MNEVSAQELNRMWDSLIVQADEQFQREGVAKDHVVYHFIADMRYICLLYTSLMSVTAVSNPRNPSPIKAWRSL